MAKQRDIRRLAMQLLYQIDVTGEYDRDAILGGIDIEHDPSPAVRGEAVDLALRAWVTHGTADEAVAELTPDWPTHRQPPVDRAILRLAHHEMTAGRVPVKVAINEAVELAKQYGTEQSPAFINGVLDKLAKQLRLSTEGQAAPKAPTADAWLKDAVDDG